MTAVADENRRPPRPSSLLRRIARAVRWVAFSLLGFVVVYALLALLLPRITLHADWRPPASGVRIFVESNGVHTDFVVPARTAVIDWSRELPPEWFERVDGSYEYLSFGWGDKRFYLETPTWADLTASTAFRAAFLLDPAAMHVTWIWRAPEVGERCRPLVLSEAQYRRLADYLLASFARDEGGRPRRIDHAGYTPQDRFFEATGRYSLVHTCNAWTGAGLDAIGVTTGLWTPFAWDVLRPLRE